MNQLPEEFDVPSSDPQADVVILGGGLAGLTAAIQIKQRRPNTNVVVLEKSRFPVAESAHKVGESSVEIGAHYFGEVLGLRTHLRAEQLPKYGLRFFFRPTGGSLGEGLEVGPSKWPRTPSFQLDRGKFENYLATEAEGLGIQLLDQARVDDIQLGSGSAHHQVSFSRDNEKHVVSGAWIVDASGRAGTLKRRLGLAEPVQHAANAAWFRIDCLIDVEELSDNPRWKESGQTEGPRHLSTNHLMGPGYWVWLIPLSSGSTSVGIVADPDLHPLNTFNSLTKALAWLKTHQPECAATIESKLASGAEVQDFLAVKHYAHGCKQVFSPHRWALTGDAGVFLDPFYSPGSDFIAMSNTYITDLICRDLQGDRIDQLVKFYEHLYLAGFQNALTLYEGLYPVWGNPRVMPVKVTWDYYFYWATIGAIFFNDFLTDLEALVPVRRDLDRAVRLHQAMQTFFKVWHQVDEPQPVAAFLDQSSNERLIDLNNVLTDRLTREEFHATFRSNVSLLEEVAAEIVLRADKWNPGLRDTFQFPKLLAGADRTSHMHGTFLTLEM